MKFWRLYCPTTEVRLDITLKCGQSFRWKLLENKDGIIGQQPSGEKFYIGVVKKRLWIVGRDGDDLLYTCVNNPEEKETELKADLEDYLQQGCISCGPCSYPELTEDHVLPSAQVKIFRTVTRNAVNKSV